MHIYLIPKWILTSGIKKLEKKKDSLLRSYQICLKSIMDISCSSQTEIWFPQEVSNVFILVCSLNSKCSDCSGWFSIISIPTASECHLSSLILQNGENKLPSILNVYFPDKKIVVLYYVDWRWDSAEKSCISKRNEWN